MNPIEKITASLSDLTKSERLIAEYILDSPQAVELYTITKIAELADASKSAVLRFCQKLDYSGYSEFRYDMINYLHNSDNGHDEKEFYDKREPFVNSLDLFKQSLDQLEKFDFSSLEKIAHSIVNSDQVYSIGIYKSGVIAQKLAYNFIDHGKEVIVLKDLVSVNHLPFHINKNAVILLFSVSGTSSQINDFLKANQEIGKRTYLITSNKRSSTAKLVKETVFLPTNGLLDKLLDPHAIHMIIVELLTQLYVNIINQNSEQ